MTIKAPRQSKMKIALLTGSVSRQGGGVYEAVRRLAIEQTESGCSVGVVGILDAGSAADRPQWLNVKLQACPITGPRSFGYSKGLRSALEGDNPDLVHQHGIWMYSSMVCRKWAARTRKPSVISPHGMLDTWAIRSAGWKKRLASWLYEGDNLRRAACLHALCDSEARAIRTLGLRNPVCVIPNGVDLPADTAAVSHARETDATRARKTLLYLGRLHPKKNLPNLLLGWAQALRQSPEVHKWQLAIAGWDQDGHQNQLSRIVSDLNLEASVRFLGPQFGECKAATLRRADAFVLPSLSEGLPMAVLEAWAYELPVLMTAECNLPEGFAAGAALAVGSTAVEIARGIAGLCERSPSELREIGNCGRRLVTRKFSWPQVSEQMRALYEWCIGGGAVPDCLVN